MRQVKIKVNNISCTNCAKTIKHGLENKFDNIKVRVNVLANNVFIIYDENKYNQNEFEKTLIKIGYPPVITNHENSHNTNDNHIKNKMIISIILSTPLLLGMLAHLPLLMPIIPHFLINPLLQLILATIIQFYIGAVFYKGAYQSLKQKVLGMDALVVIGTTTAYFYSVILVINSFFTNTQSVLFFEVSGLLITIILIGKYLEHLATNKAQKELEKLVSTRPQIAHKIVKNKIFDIDPIDLEIGDIVKVLPGEYVPIDGLIIDGSSNFDESAFTGESNQVFKKVNDMALGGTINISQTITIQLVKNIEDTILYTIIDKIEEASLVDNKYQKFADKISGYFALAVILIAALTLIVNMIISQDFTFAISTAIAVVIISCPCALGLATPMAIIMGNSEASKNGILYQGGNFFEIGYKIKVICFDKTKTLTYGKPDIEKIKIPKNLIPYINEIEKMSNHPISKAFVKKHHKLNVDNFKIITHKQKAGIGLLAETNKGNFFIGNKRGLKQLNLKSNQLLSEIENFEKEGYTVTIIAHNGEIVGFYNAIDQIREDAKYVITELKKQNIKPVMITGDNHYVAQKIAKKLGIKHIHSEIMPVGKSEIVKKYQQNETIVAFVGDGVNDAVALKTANIGITVWGGSDIAINNSDVTIMQNDLSKILVGIEISRKVSQNIKENFVWAFSYNIIAIPLAATGNLSMLLAGIAMSFSNIVVILNAMRLKNLKLIKK